MAKKKPLSGLSTKSTVSPRGERWVFADYWENDPAQSSYDIYSLGGVRVCCAVPDKATAKYIVTLHNASLKKKSKA